MQGKSFQVVYDSICLTDYDTASCETPSRVAVIIECLSQYYPITRPKPADDEDVLRVHSRSLLNSVKEDPEIYHAALTAAGGAIAAAEMAYEGSPAFAAIRPPGHHASPSSNWGFCFFNNVAISIEKLIRKKRIQAALILDIDLHFGDGTDNFFYHRPNVVVANIQENSRDSFLKAVDSALAKNEYDIIAVSAGFDCHVQDWGGTLKTSDYFAIGRSVREHAALKCDSRYFAVLEGGYNLEVLGLNALALCKGMDPLNQEEFV